VDDNTPEVDELFNCIILDASSPGQVGSNTKISVTILASDKPFGEYLVTMDTRNVIANEPMLPKYNGSFVIR